MTSPCAFGSSRTARQKSGTSLREERTWPVRCWRVGDWRQRSGHSSWLSQGAKPRQPYGNRSETCTNLAIGSRHVLKLMRTAPCVPNTPQGRHFSFCWCFQQTRKQKLASMRVLGCFSIPCGVYESRRSVAVRTELVRMEWAVSKNWHPARYPWQPWARSRGNGLETQSVEFAPGRAQRQHKRVPTP